MSDYKTETIVLWPADVEASGQPSSHEQGFILPPTNDYFIRNITQPTLTIFRPATEWNYAPERIGAIGFSAGGRIVIELTIASDPETRPAFVASIYGALFSDLIGDGSVHQLASVSSSVPPLFMVVAADDPIGLDEPAYRCYQAWRRAGSPAELHIYAQGGHGFGMNKKGLPSDTWIDRFGDWLQAIVL